MKCDYYANFNNLLEDNIERTFTDRETIMQLLFDSLVDLNQNSNYYHIIDIYGMGGIGKTRLLKEFITRLSPEPIFFITFEIEKRSEIINNIYQIRCKLKKNCPVFDYALLCYWNMTNPEILNKDFMKHFKDNFFSDVLDVIANITGCAKSNLPTIQIPVILSVNSILTFMDSLFQRIPQLLHKSIFSKIKSSTNDELLDLLPRILGVEIRNQILQKDIPNPIFVFDSYQKSQPYSDSEEWLYHIISNINLGLYIITGREPLNWPINKKHFSSYLLDCYPKEDAKKLLEETIINRPDLVDLIIEITQCIPIYIDIALNVYEKESQIVGSDLIDKALFKDRNKLIKHFINHLEPEFQSTILDLATIGVFNQEIFHYLSKERMIASKAYNYEEIVKGSLCQYLSYGSNNNLVKIHEVFSRDVQHIRPLAEFYSIFKTYVDYICFRRDIIVNENNGSTLSILLQNILSLAISIEARIKKEKTNVEYTIETSIIEKMLDIFFTLISYRIRFYPQAPNKINTPIMQDVLKFIYAKTFEKQNTLKTLQRLTEIKKPYLFGKHNISYEAVLYYTKALTGQYHQLENWINDIDKNLTDKVKQEWFYNRIKIYKADCDMMHGRFKTAHMALSLLQNGYLNNDDDYSIRRTIGHIYRFNFQVEKAALEYNNLLKSYNVNPVYYEYLTTNLCETKCYFPSTFFINKAEKFLKTMTDPYNIKNKAKVYYSLAIAYIVKKDYYTAQKYINKSIKINQQDGYISGKLFAYIAQAYLDYARDNKINDSTNKKIHSLIEKNKVYSFLKLPLLLITNNIMDINKILHLYEWLNFDETIYKYKLFIHQLR